MYIQVYQIFNNSAMCRIAKIMIYLLDSLSRLSVSEGVEPMGVVATVVSVVSLGVDPLTLVCGCVACSEGVVSPGGRSTRG